MQRIVLSASSISTFMECRKRYEYEKIRMIAPRERPAAFDFGHIVHRGLETIFEWQKVDDIDKSGLHDDFIPIDQAKRMALDSVVEAGIDEMPEEDIIKAKALVEKYIDIYWQTDIENYRVIDVEKNFELPLINPDTGRQSPKYFIRGYVDAVFMDGDGELYIVEHKTSGQVRDGYFDRVNIDWQVAIYADTLSRAYGKPIHHVIYDVLKKPKHEMAGGETDEEFEARKAASKAPGRIKRKESETPEMFAERMREAVTDEYFIRKTYTLDEQTMLEFRREIWAVAHEIGQCKTFYKCTGNCLKYSGCPFMKLCCANGNLDGLEDVYRQTDPLEIYRFGEIEIPF